MKKFFKEILAGLDCLVEKMHAKYRIIDIEGNLYLIRSMQWL